MSTFTATSTTSIYILQPCTIIVSNCGCSQDVDGGLAHHTFSGMLVAPQVVLVTMFMHYDHCLGQLWLCDIKVSIDFYSQHMLKAVALPT